METIERIWIALAGLLGLSLAGVLAVALVAAGSSVWTRFFPQKPPEIIMATGPEGLAYRNYGERYKEALKGVTVVPVRSNGSPQNLEMLRDPNSPAKIALIQGDTTIGGRVPALESLGTVFYDTLWLFVRKPGDGNDGSASRPLAQKGINDLRGKRIAIGPDNSGTQNLARRLLEWHGISSQTAEFLTLNTDEASSQLLAGRIDAAFFATSWDAKDVRTLRTDPRVELWGYPQADAYAAFFPYLRKVVLPRGASDPIRDQPPEDLPLIATKASLIVRKDLNRWIQYRLLDAAKQIHEKPVIQLGTDKFPAKEAPTAKATSTPLSAAANDFYDQGTFYETDRLLADLLPPVIAEPIIDGLFFLLIAIGALGIAAPAFRALWLLVNWWWQQPVLQLLVAVMGLEEALALDAGDHSGKLRDRLKELEQKAQTLLHRARARGVAGAPATALLVMLLEERIQGLHRRLQPGTEPDPAAAS
jgi:TRAP-type uncharacterized transport system substrate-binding protein